ncbi:extracellular matrix protein [Diaporthe sp. PMI_573]|nr:extracellular matrix protein [Diaporthaceae sp. PMI_573]
MKFTAGFIAVVTAAAPAWAIQLTNSAYAVEAGQPFTLTWTDSQGPVTITLKNGPSTNLGDVEVIGSGVTGNSFTWTPPSSLPSDTYAFEVADSSSDSPNYSPQFTFQGNGAATTAASSSSAASSASVSTTLSSRTITSSASSASATASSNSSATITSTTSGNSTTTSSSSSSTRTSTRTSASSTSESTSTSTPVNTNDSQKLGSPLALILGTIVSLMIFN